MRRSNYVLSVPLALIPAFESLLLIASDGWRLYEMAPRGSTGTPSEERNLIPLHITSNRVASRRLMRALILLNRAGRQLDFASQATPDRFHRDRLHSFAEGLRELSIPLSRLASRFEKGGEL